MYVNVSFTKPRTCALVNFTGETKNFRDCLLFSSPEPKAHG